MGLYKKLDLWSIQEGLEKVIDYAIDGNEKSSPYWDFYEDQINELSILAADMHDEFQKIRGIIYREFPWKENRFFKEDFSSESRYTEIAWWNTAACMLSDTDMWVLLENEAIYDSDIAEEKKKRIRAFERLTKKQQMVLWTDVIGFITRYLELIAAFETVTAVIRELDYHQSFIKTRDGITAPDAAYL